MTVADQIHQDGKDLITIAKSQVIKRRPGEVCLDPPEVPRGFHASAQRAKLVLQGDAGDVSRLKKGV